ncbi:MAG TPA: ABC transporter ATP-binding protein [Longimicrobium sp.]|jgi:ABC-2 type transport system ATP-binding protein|uniref:ABC transporter ATP-binding protein n=1 Tax=Longimicrobium sp. TaxID=2029185 RepID=UPI002ED7A1DF
MIHLTDVGKDFGGPLARLRRERVRALDGVSLHVPAGTAVGLVGPNGAGKSTVIKLLLGYLHPSRGGVEVGGMLPRDYVERHGVSYVPDRVTLPPWWTVRGALRTFAALAEVDDWEERVEREMARMELNEVAHRRVRALSKGNLQRLALAQALLADRKVMVLDEPTDGLDPEWVARVREVLAGWRAADPERVLVFASHDLDEVERVADQVVVLRAGRVHEVLATAGEGPVPSWTLVVEGTESARLVEKAFPGALPLTGEAHAFRVEAGSARDVSRRVQTLLERGGVVRALTPGGGSLRERYRAMGARRRGPA